MRFTFPIYPISDTGLSGLSHASQTALFIESGVSLVQLREKQMTSRAFYDDAAQALKIARAAGVKLLINDRVDIAMALGADGVHLGQDDLPPRQAREMLGADALIGFSTHNPEQAVAAIGLPIDYIALGPVFSTKTKIDAEPVTGPDVLAEVRSRIGEFPLVAIGGIDPSNVSIVSAAGADAAAVVGSLFTGPGDVKKRIKSLNGNWSKKMFNNVQK